MDHNWMMVMLRESVALNSVVSLANWRKLSFSALAVKKFTKSSNEHAREMAGFSLALYSFVLSLKTVYSSYAPSNYHHHSHGTIIVIIVVSIKRYRIEHLSRVTVDAVSLPPLLVCFFCILWLQKSKERTSKGKYNGTLVLLLLLLLFVCWYAFSMPNWWWRLMVNVKDVRSMFDVNISRHVHLLYRFVWKAYISFA